MQKTAERWLEEKYKACKKELVDVVERNRFLASHCVDTVDIRNKYEMFQIDVILDELVREKKLQRLLVTIGRYKVTYVYYIVHDAELGVHFGDDDEKT